MTSVASVVSAPQPVTGCRSSSWWRSRRALHATALAVALLIATLTGPATARADTGATLYVDQHSANCSDTGAGTSGQPFCTIGAAAAQTAPGTTVIVSSGTYAETVKPPTSGTPGNPVTFTAAPGANVVLTGSPSSAWVFEVARQSWVTVKGLTFSGSPVCVIGASNVDIADNDVTSGGVALTNSSQIAVIGNQVPQSGIHVTDSSGADVEDNTGGGITLSGATQSRVAGNSITSGGIRLYGAGGNTLDSNVIHASGKGVDDEWSSNNVIVNNAIINGAGPYSSVPSYAIEVIGADYNAYSGYPNTSGTQILSNSIVQDAPSVAVDVDESSKTTLANNIIDVPNSAGGPAIRVTPTSLPGSSIDYDVVNVAASPAISWNYFNYSSLTKLAAATHQEVHGIQAPAGFADLADGNLTLTPGSPAVDSALSGSLTTSAGSILLPTTDIFGSSRVDDAATPNTGAGTIGYADRGAYEMHNPGFEANTAGWNTSGSGPAVTLTQVSGGHTGNGAALLTNTGTTTATCTLNDSPNIVHTTIAGTYTATVWVRADTPGATLTLRLREWAGTTAVGQAKTLVTLTSQWQPVTVQYTAADPGAPTLDFSAYVLNAPPGTCFYADDASVYDG